MGHEDPRTNGSGAAGNARDDLTPQADTSSFLTMPSDATSLPPELSTNPGGETSGRRPRRADGWEGYAWGLAASVAVTGISWVGLRYLELADVVMIYLLGVVIIATRLGLGPSLLSAAMGVMAFDYFIIPPVFHFTAEFHHVVTLVGMISVASIVSGLTGRLRKERERARLSEEYTSALYAFERELAAARSLEQLATATSRHFHSLCDAEIALFVPRGDTIAQVASVPSAALDALRDALEQAHETLASGEAIWPSQGGHGDAYLPLVGLESVVGVLRLRPRGPASPKLWRRPLLEACCRQLASAVDRMARRSEAERAQMEIQAERIRNALLSSVSHDVRTPLAMISASAQMLVRSHEQMDPAARGELLADIADQADRLDDFLRNLAAMTRAEAGELGLRTEPGSMQEVAASALRRSTRALEARPIEVRAARDLPLVAMDASLFEQVFVNLLENAARYSPSGSGIDIEMTKVDEDVVVEVKDRGPGVPVDEREKVFDKFYRGRRAPKSDGGMGLGLAICRAIVVAHGGTIRMEDREGGGAVVRFVLAASRMSLRDAVLRLPEVA